MKYRISWTGPETGEVVIGVVRFTSLETAHLAAAVFRALSPERNFSVEPAEDVPCSASPVQ
jgi:hypothetical protein